MKHLSAGVVAGLLAAILQPTATRTTAVASYDMTIAIAPDRHRFDVEGRVRLPAQAADRTEIEFVLSPKMSGLEVHLVDPAGDLELRQAREDGGDIRWTYSSSVPLPAGKPVTLSFAYSSRGRDAPQLRVGPDGSFAGGGGELWYPQTEFKQREIGTLRFRVPPGDRVIANGAPGGDTARQAAGEFTFEVSRPSKFAFASGPYVEAKRGGRVPLELYSLRPRAASGQILDGAAGALDVLSDLFGPFPYPQFSLVEVDFPTIVLGTSEFGFILADGSKLDDFDLAYWAHEIGHQWWGNLVRSASGTTGQMMLSEGVAQFGALRAVETMLGPAAAAEFRRVGFRGTGQSARAYFELVNAGSDLPLTTHLPKSNETLTMHRLVNTKGFILLDMLRREMGAKRFDAALRAFVASRADATTSWQEFQRSLVEAGAPAWFFADWFERTGAPDFRVTWRATGRRVRGTITQSEPVYRATVELRLEGRGGRTFVVAVPVMTGSQTFDVDAPFPVRTVLLDPDYKTLRWLPEFRARRKDADLDPADLKRRGNERLRESAARHE